MPTAPHSPGSVGALVARLDKIAAGAGEAARDLREASADSTWKGYRSDLVDYDLWCQTDRRRLWSSPSTIAAYLRALGDAGAAYATIERRKSAISKLFEAESLVTDEVGENPTRHPRVGLALKALRKQLGTDQDKAEPLTADLLLQVLLAIDAETNAGHRDITLLLTGFFGALRVSELAAITPAHLKFEPEGVVITLPDSKGQDETVWVPIHRQSQSRWDAVSALENWIEHLAIAGVDPRPTGTGTGAPHLNPAAGIWRRVTKGDTFYKPSKSISVDAIADIVTRRVKAAGLANADGYSPHSLRAGFITEAKNRGIDEADIMRHTRHKSIMVMRGYDRASGLWLRNATSRMQI